MESNEVKAVVNAETFPQMVERLFKKMGSQTLDLLHASVGIAGEAGEYVLAVCNADMKNIPEELGDARFYLQAIMNQFGWSLEDFKGAEFAPTQTRTHMYTFVIKASDVLDLVKKSWVYGKELDVEKFDREVGELAGVYLEIIRSHGYNDDDICAKNMYKLSTGPDARYPLGYTDAAAIARADKLAEEAAAPAAAEKSPFKDIVVN